MPNRIYDHIDPHLQTCKYTCAYTRIRFLVPRSKRDPYIEVVLSSKFVMSPQVPISITAAVIVTNTLVPLYNHYALHRSFDNDAFTQAGAWASAYVYACNSIYGLHYSVVGCCPHL